MATAAEFVARNGGNVDDPNVVRAVAIANAWACDELGCAGDDELAGLNPRQLDGILGYAADVFKLPKVTFGVFDAAGETEGLAAAVALDLGKRWRSFLIRYTTTDQVGGMA